MGPEVVYVSGRKRTPGEMNGKSANLNNCLKQIYPDGVPIPGTELVCIFDADQVANVDFFCKMLPKFDAGERLWPVQPRHTCVGLAELWQLWHWGVLLHCHLSMPVLAVLSGLVAVL